MRKLLLFLSVMITVCGQGIDAIPRTFASLTYAQMVASAYGNGTQLYCTDCSSSNPATNGGTGFMARKENGAWNSSTGISGVIGISNTPLTTRGDILVVTAGPALNRLAKGTQYQTLQGGAADTLFDAVHLDQATAVSGILPNASTTAASANTASAIVARDGSGNFTAGTITATLTGNASTASALAANPSDCGANTYANVIAANGNLSCVAIDLANGVSGILGGLNGGTGNGFTAFGGPATSLKTFTLPNASAAILTDNALVTGPQGGTNNGFFAVTGPTTSLKTFTFPNASATVLTTNAAVSVPQGGTGVATLTGIVKGNGTSAFSAALAADIYGLWSGTCNSSTFLRGDGSCQATAGSGTVTVESSGTVPSTYCLAGAGSQAIRAPSSLCTIDSSGNIAATSLSTGGSADSSCDGTAGCTIYHQGTQPSGQSAANGIQVVAPTSVTSYRDVRPGTVGATGVELVTVAGVIATHSYGLVTSAVLNITTSTCTNQFVRSISSGAVGTCASIAAADLSAALITPAKMAASTFDAQTDAATITWAIGSVKDAQATVTLGGNRTLNITNPVIGGNYVFRLTQDGTGSRTLALGTGCTWKVANGGAGAIVLSTAAASVDVLTFTYDGASCLASLGKGYN